MHREATYERSTYFLHKQLAFQLRGFLPFNYSEKALVSFRLLSSVSYESARMS